MPTTINVTAQLYDSFIAAFGSEIIDLATDQLYVALATSSYVPNHAADTHWSTPQAFEPSGTGYTAGGQQLTGTSWSGTVYSCANPSWTGLTLTNVRYLVIYDKTTGTGPSTYRLVGYIDLGSAQTLSGQPLSIVLPGGILLTLLSGGAQISAVTVANILDAGALGRELLLADDSPTVRGELNVPGNLGPVGSQSEMLALTGNVGDYCYRTDLGMFYFWMPAGAGGVPGGGVTVPIPASQLAADVQTKLSLAATALQPATAMPSLPIFGPADYGVDIGKPWGGWSHDLAACNSTGLAPNANGLVSLVRLPVRVPVTITNIILGITTAGAGLTSGQNLAGLFQGGNLLSSTADQSTAWQSAGLKTMALSSPQSVDPANGAVYAGFFANGTTRPIFAMAAASTAMVFLAPAFMRYGYDSTHLARTTSLPSTLGTIGLNAAFWAAWS